MLSAAAILIVTHETDPHADRVTHVLRTLGHQAVRLNLADVPMRSALTFTFDNAGWGGTLRAGEQIINVRSLRSIWWRRPARYRLPAELSEQEERFARLELEYTLQGVWDALDCYWMSHPQHIRATSYKPSQLQRAATLGFEVPKTLITTDPEAARAFYGACDGEVIYKIVSDPMLGLGARLDEALAVCLIPGSPGHEPTADWSRVNIKATFTTRITETELGAIETVRLAPCQFQEYVPKRLELRVTVVGDDLFVAEIHSQAHARTRLDWRRYDVAIPYRKGVLPPDVAARCLALTKSYGLNFAALDLIVTPDDRFVFLEINPNGQWLWLQQLVPELRIAEAIADRLIRGNTAA